MDKSKIDKYKRIYREQVLPKKNVTKNTKETYESDLKIISDYSIYRERVNKVLLGGGEDCGTEKQD